METIVNNIDGRVTTVDVVDGQEVRRAYSIEEWEAKKRGEPVGQPPPKAGTSYQEAIADAAAKIKAGEMEFAYAANNIARHFQVDRADVAKELEALGAKSSDDGQR